MKELDALYDWLWDMKNTRNSYGKAGIKMIYQSDVDKGMKLYLELKKAVESQRKAIKHYFDNKKIIKHIDEELNK